jgi:hypothetical protein
LAQELFPEGVQWPYPLKRGWFEMSTLPGLLDPARKRTWIGLDDDGKPVSGALARLSSDNQGWQLILLVPPHLRGSDDRNLAVRALADLGNTGLSFNVSYPPDLIDDALIELGFKAGRTLTWMGLALDESSAL